MNDHGIWNRKGVTLSDKTAKKEFGLSQQEIYQAVREKKLQYRENHVFGNPYLRLLRHEVEALVAVKLGQRGLDRKKMERELTATKRQLRLLNTEVAALERKQAELQDLLGK